MKPPWKYYIISLPRPQLSEPQNEPNCQKNAMRRASKSLHLCLSLARKLLSKTEPSTTPIKHLPLLRPLSTTTSEMTSAATVADASAEKDRRVQAKPSRDSFILEKFRQRKQQGTTTKADRQVPGKPGEDSFVLEKFRQRKLQGCAQQEGKSCSRAETGGRTEGTVGNDGGATKVVSSFEELGLREELIEAAGEMGVWVPSEIQCVGIPAVLEGKSVVLSSDSGSGRTLAYLLPLLQLLTRNLALSGMKRNHPEAIILCTTEELSDEVFSMAEFIIDLVRSKAAKQNSPRQFPGVSDNPIGMLIGTPSEILQQIEERSAVTGNVKYLALDEADEMFHRGFGAEISKIISPLKTQISESNNQGFQTIMVTSSITKILGAAYSPFMKQFQNSKTGTVAAMLLELEQKEAFDIISSPDVLRKKVAEALDFLGSAS